MIFAEILNKYIDLPYSEYGCMDLLISLCKDLDLDIPNEFDGINSDNYYDLWKNDKEKAEKILISFFNSIGKEVSPKLVVARDLLIIRQEKNIFPAMYAGNGNAITSCVKTGVTVISIGNMDNIVLARRLGK